MNQNFNYDNVYTTQPQTPVTNSQISEKMLTLYFNLCAERNVTPINVEFMTRQQFQKELDQVRNMPLPISTNQIETIKNLINDLVEMGSTKHFQLADAQMKRMNRKQASDMIERLAQARRELEPVALPSHEQLRTLCAWYICPDIPFEDVGINKVVYLEDIQAWTHEDKYGNKREVVPFRQMTGNEFAKEICRVFKRLDAQQFIRQFEQTYRLWKKTRMTSDDMQQYRRLEQTIATMIGERGFYRNNQEERMAELSTGEYQDRAGAETNFGKVERNSEGKYFRVTLGEQKYNEDTKEYEFEKVYTEIKHINFEPISDRYLHMLSAQEGKKLIAQMQDELAELRAKNMSVDVYDDSQEVLEFKHSEYKSQGQRDNSYRAERGGTYHRLAPNTDTAREMEMVAVERVLAQVEARAGYANDELKEVVSEAILDGDNTKSAKALEEMYNFFIMTINMKNEDTVRKTIGELQQISEESLVASEVVARIRQDFLPQDVQAEDEFTAKRKAQLAKIV